MKLIFALLLLPLCGCISTSKIVEQLKNDPATIDFSISTIYGNVNLHRSFPTNWVQPIQLTMPVAVSTNSAGK